MAIVRWDPFRYSRSPLLWDWDEADSTPVMTSNIDMYETDNQVVVNANVPGVTEKDIDVTFERGVLWVRADAQDEKTTKQNGRKYFKKATRNFSYQVNVPESVDWSSEPKADLSQGVLTVTFKKAAEAKPKRIAVKGK